MLHRLFYVGQREPKSLYSLNVGLYYGKGRKPFPPSYTLTFANPSFTLPAGSSRRSPAISTYNLMEVLFEGLWFEFKDIIGRACKNRKEV
jgi:hypothetical protein